MVQKVPWDKEKEFLFCTPLGFEWVHLTPIWEEPMKIKRKFQWKPQWKRLRMELGGQGGRAYACFQLLPGSRNFGYSWWQAARTDGYTVPGDWRCIWRGYWTFDMLMFLLNIRIIFLIFSWLHSTCSFSILIDVSYKRFFFSVLVIKPRTLHILYHWAPP
jgi:hypothetical protein